MFNYLITILIIISTVTTITSAQIIATFSKTKNNSLEPLGIVYPDQCGGVGRYISFVVSDCLRLPCNVTDSTVFELTFVPSTTIWFPYLRYTVTPKSGSPDSGSVEIGQSLPGGYEILLRMSSLADSFYKKNVNIRFEVLNDVQIPEVCFSAEYNSSNDESTHMNE